MPRKLKIIANILPVGPRAGLASRDEIVFALQLSAGYERGVGAEPLPVADRARAALPWHFVQADGEIHVAFRVRDETGSESTEIVRLTADAYPADPSLAQPLRDRFEEEFVHPDLEEEVLFWDTPTHPGGGGNGTPEESDAELETTDVRRPHELAMYASTLDPAVASALRTTRFFRVAFESEDVPFPGSRIVRMVAAPVVRWTGDPTSPETHTPDASPPIDASAAGGIEWSYTTGAPSDTAVAAFVAPFEPGVSPDGEGLGLDFGDFWLDRIGERPHHLLESLDLRLVELLDPAALGATLTDRHLAEGDEADAGQRDVWRGDVALAGLFVDVDLWTQGQSATDRVRTRQIRLLCERAGEALATWPQPPPPGQEPSAEFDAVVEGVAAAYAYLRRMPRKDVAKSWRGLVARRLAIEEAVGPEPAESPLALAARMRERPAALDSLAPDLWLDVLRRVLAARQLDDPAASPGPSDFPEWFLDNLEALVAEAHSLGEGAGTLFEAGAGSDYSARKALRDVRSREAHRAVAGVTSDDLPLPEVRTALRPSVDALVERLSDAPVLPQGAATAIGHSKVRKEWLSELLRGFLQLENDDSPVPLVEERSRGLRVRLGGLRATHDSTEADPSDGLRHVSGLGLVLRRRSAGQAGRWSIVSAGRLVLRPESPSALPQRPGQAIGLVAGPSLIPIRQVYQNDVTNPTLSYEGALLGIDDHLGTAVATYQLSGEDGPLQWIGYEQLGSYPAGSHLVAIPLRYGDEVDAGVFMIGSAGGVPARLARADAPYAADFAAIEQAGWDPEVPSGKLATLAYLRRVPVGGVNLTPGGPVEALSARNSVPARKREWPALPADVIPRAHELRGLDGGPGEDDAPILLMSALAGASIGTYPGCPGRARIEVAAPAVDELTLMRWTFPAVGDPDAADAVDELRRVHTRYFEARNERDENAPGFTISDPAVAAIRVELVAFRASEGRFELVQDLDIPLVRGARGTDEAQTAHPFTAKVRCESGGGFSLDRTTNGVEAAVPDGSVAFLRFSVLVARDAWARFHAAAKLRMEADESGTGPIVLPGSAVWIESVTPRLPTADEVWHALRVERAGDVVAISFRPRDIAPNPGEESALEYVAGAEVWVERWTWRGRPLWLNDPSGKEPAAVPSWDPSGAPPGAIHGPAQDRDVDTELLKWEAVAEMGDAFVRRRLAEAPFPDGARRTAALADEVSLARDDLAATPAAEVRRYAAVLRSRYEGVLPEHKRRVRSLDSAKGGGWRRIFVPYRGPRPTTPLVAAVLPLTRGVRNPPNGEVEPRPTLSAPAPQLVIFDEVAYREYGLGERISAEVVLDVVDGEEDQPVDGVPYRVGPLPDHYWNLENRPGAPKYWRTHPGTDPDGEEPEPPKLDVFGPFGHTFERSDREPRLSASSYVIQPPLHAGPHWTATVRLRREILGWDASARSYVLREDLRSEPTTTLPLVFRPDARFHRQDGGSDDLSAGTVTLASDGSLAIATEQFYVLHPTARAIPPSDVEDPAATTHRYFILASRGISDAGGNPTAEEPLAVYRVPVGGTRATALGSAASGNDLIGRVLEVQLSGRWETASPPFDADDLAARGFWELLFPRRHPGDTSHGDPLVRAQPYDLPDAAGVIQRVSLPFRIAGS